MGVELGKHQQLPHLEVLVIKLGHGDRVAAEVIP